MRSRSTVLAGGLAIAAATVGGGGIVTSELVAREMLLREGPVSQLFLESIVRAQSIAEADLKTGGGRLKSFATHVENMPGVLRATIYSTDGFIRHSTEAQLIGIKFHDNGQLERAIAGEIAVKIEESGVGEGEQLGLNLRAGAAVVEAYIPVRGAGGKIIGVVEYYRPAEEYEAALAPLRRQLWMVNLGCFMLLAGVFAAALWSGKLAR